MADEKKLMRISELAKVTGVSVPTIHFYLREGLILPPTKTAPNIAYYGPEYVEDIRLIKELQTKRYLPLALIKLVLEAKREGQEISHIHDMRLSIEELFRPLATEEHIEPVALVELVVMTGLPAATLQELESMDLLMPADTPDGKRYDGLDIQIARMLKRLLDLGLALSDLQCYSQYVGALRAETMVVHDKTLRHDSAASSHVSGKELKELLDSLKSALATKVYRRVVLEIHRGGKES